MNKLILFLLVSTLISTGYFQEANNNFYSSSFGNEIPNAQLNSRSLQGPQVKPKPCSRRNSNHLEEPWIQSYSSRITHDVPPDSLIQPQALKNAEINLASKPEAPAAIAPAIPKRRSLSSGPKPAETEEDCAEEPATALSNNSGAIAINILKGCLKRKQNQILGSSRRSMAEPDPIDSEEADDEPQDTDLLSRKANFGNDNSEVRLKDTLLNPRVCYACSTATNPSCWEPSKKTTVKYCTREQSCVTKAFGTKNALTVIRDCADSCDDSSVPGIEPKFNKCNICHSDLCNGAFTISPLNIAIVLVISCVKYTFY